jgi:hypothetical protein
MTFATARAAMHFATEVKRVPCLNSASSWSIYHTLKNNWVFEDFPNFVLAEAKP